MKEPQNKEGCCLGFVFFFSRLHLIPVLAVLLLCCISQGVYIYL